MVENVIQIKIGITINVDVYEKHHICEKDYINGNIVVNSNIYGYGKYLASIIEDLVMKCDKIIDAEKRKTIQTNFNEKKKIIIKTFYILLDFLLITITLLIALSIYGYLIKYKAKQKHVMP